MSLIGKIRKLSDIGVLGPELCPEPHYWHWNVLKPDLLPSDLKAMYIRYGEIRWYG